MLFYLTEIQEKIGYTFKDDNLLRECFTHPSYLSNTKEHDYDRAEFLGDSVLGFVVADYLYKKGNSSEGSMTSEKQKIVSTIPLSIATRRLGVEKYVLKNESVKMTDKLCENLFEAIVGGIYLDGGLEKAKEFIYNNLINAHVESCDNNYKSQLNEYVAQHKLGEIKYVVQDKIGKDNSPTFVVALHLNDKKVATGKGSRKVIAEQQCAEKALKILRKKVK